MGWGNESLHADDGRTSYQTQNFEKAREAIYNSVILIVETSPQNLSNLEFGKKDVPIVAACSYSMMTQIQFEIVAACSYSMMSPY